MAASGKLNRCQLGHFEQLEREQHLQSEIKKAIKSRIQTGVLGECMAVTTKPDLSSKCLLWLQHQENATMLAEMKAILLQVAKCSPPIAGIIRHFGFRAQNKFGNFNAVEAAHAIVLHESSFLADLESSLRTQL